MGSHLRFLYVCRLFLELKGVASIFGLRQIQHETHFFRGLRGGRGRLKIGGGVVYLCQVFHARHI